MTAYPEPMDCIHAESLIQGMSQLYIDPSLFMQVMRLLAAHDTSIVVWADLTIGEPLVFMIGDEDGQRYKENVIKYYEIGDALQSFAGRVLRKFKNVGVTAINIYVLNGDDSREYIDIEGISPSITYTLGNRHSYTQKDMRA